MSLAGRSGKSDAYAVGAVVVAIAFIVTSPMNCWNELLIIHKCIRCAYHEN